MEPQELVQRRQDAHGPELIFTSSTSGVAVLECDLWSVLYRMLQRKTADRVSAGVVIFLSMQVPDRSIALRWVDAGLQWVGDWTEWQSNRLGEGSNRGHGERRRRTP